LQEEIKQSKREFDEDIKIGFKEEKSNLNSYKIAEIENMTKENAMMSAEILKFKILLRQNMS